MRSYGAALTLSQLPRLLLENPLHDAGADAELLADLEDAITIGPRRSPVNSLLTNAA
jgi:hypothetical protein